MRRQGEVLFAQVETSKGTAEQLAQGLKAQYREQGHKVTARVFPRTVRANSIDLPVYVVVVRAAAVQS
jgi:hypothetical protein